MLSSSTSGELPVDTPFPTCYGYQLAALLTAPGSRVSATPVAASDSVLAHSSELSGVSGRAPCWRSAGGRSDVHNHAAQAPTTGQDHTRYSAFMAIFAITICNRRASCSTPTLREGRPDN